MLNMLTAPCLATVRPQASVMTHLQHDLEIFQIFLGCLPSFFFCNHDLWSWIVAKLHHSIASVILHLLHNFKFSTFLGQQVQLQPPEVIVIFDCFFSSWRNLHRSHFGSRYTLGCCGHAGLSVWGSIPPASPNLCLLPRDDGTPLAC